MSTKMLSGMPKFAADEILVARSKINEFVYQIDIERDH